MGLVAYEKDMQCDMRGALGLIGSGVLTIGALVGGCASQKPHEPHEAYGFTAPSPERLAKWRDQNGLIATRPEERATAGNCRAWFRNQRATSTDGKMQVVFQAGTLVGKNSLGRGLSTTSTYLLRDAQGRKLATAPSRCTEAMTQADQAALRRAVWFSPQGDRVVVYEYSGANEGPLTIIFSSQPESEGGWDVRFVRLPCCAFATEDEGVHANCNGFIGDELLIDPAIGDGRIYKKGIRDLADDYPFPFFLG